MDLSNGTWANCTNAVRHCSECKERLKRYWYCEWWDNGVRFVKRLCEDCKESKNG